jgi:hypothetical protein
MADGGVSSRRSDPRPAVVPDRNRLQAGTEPAATVKRVTAAYRLCFRMQDYDLVEQPTHSGLRTVPRVLQTRITTDGRKLP